MKTEAGWHDACIVDLGKRGVGLQAATAPGRGDYVEIRRGLHVIVARVVWSRGHRFGVAAQDDLPVANIASDLSPSGPAKVAGEAAKIERRRLPRSFDEKAERSRRIGQRMQYLFAAVAAMIERPSPAPKCAKHWPRRWRKLQVRWSDRRIWRKRRPLRASVSR